MWEPARKPSQEGANPRLGNTFCGRCSPKALPHGTYRSRDNESVRAKDFKPEQLRPNGSRVVPLRCMDSQGILVTATAFHAPNRVLDVLEGGQRNVAQVVVTEGAPCERGEAPELGSLR